ncbi:MAG: PhoH-like ATPase [Candidatus Woesearchaeota archaeon]|nr:PhoH-like ATPase [Candidatus Woesearchaeota archaeon]MDN5328086.1 PhoH-like ATPase [Candidatus Woesearchaeota archaeon]
MVTFKYMFRENLLKMSNEVMEKESLEDKVNTFPFEYNENAFLQNLQDNKKVYSVDTNILLIDPFAPFYLTGNDVPQELKTEFSNKYGLNFPTYEPVGKPNNFVLSQVVEKELDRIKDDHKKDGYVRFMARRALDVLRFIYDLGWEKGEIPTEGITLPNKGKFLYVLHDKDKFNKTFQRYFKPDDDVRIIYDLLNINKMLNEDQELIMITEDGSFINKAMVIGVKFSIENYKRERITQYDSVYSGKQVLKREEELSEKYKDFNVIIKKGLDEIITDFKIPRELIRPNMVLKFDPPLSEDEPWKNYLFITGDKEHIKPPENFEQYLQDCWELDKKYLYNNRNSNKDKIQEYDQQKIINKLNRVKDQVKKSKKSKITKSDLLKIISREFNTDNRYLDEFDVEEEFFSVEEMFSKYPFHKNIMPEGDQIPFFEFLLSKEIPVVSVIGEQGAGKSVLALLAGLYQVWKRDYERISYVRSTKEIGAQPIGFLPGSESDKMEPWKRSVRDNLIDIFYDRTHRGDLWYKKRLEDFIYQLEKVGLIEFLTPQFLQGRTLNDRFIIVDEAQNFPRTVASIILGRTGETSKIVFLGDPKQLDAVQYTDRFVNKYNTGIIHIAERLKDLAISAHITLPKGFNKRSAASKAATLL